MKITCIRCGDWFTADKEDVKLLEDGHILKIEPICDDCLDVQLEDFDYFSDADQAL